MLSTPIAEAGIAGVSNGMALSALRPVAEIMFADFVTLAADQLINFAAKFHYMYGGRLACPGDDPAGLGRRARLRPDAQPEPGVPVLRHRWLAGGRNPVAPA